MLGKPFFTLCQLLQEARTFEDVSDLLSNRMPVLIGAEDVCLMVHRRSGGVDSIHGHGPVAVRMRERKEDFDRLVTEHPILSFVDLTKPGELGYAMSDYVSPDVYRESDFNQIVKGPDLASEDCLLGRVSTNHDRYCLMVACRHRGIFTASQRQIFDTMLFISRAVLERIAGGNVEAQVTKFLLTARAEHPNAFFVLRGESEVMPLNCDAVQFSERFWGEDEAVKIVDAETMHRIHESLEHSWKDPIISVFGSVSMDLGKGEAKVYAMYKPDGNILLLMPITGEEEEAAERLAAILTRRQQEIMDWIAEGKTSAEVAIILNISPRTVEKHLEAVFQRLGVENRIAAVRRYLDLQAGLPI